MLTGDLVRARVKGRDITPSLIDPTRPSYVERAEDLLDLFGEAVAKGWTRGEVDEAINDLIGDGQDARIVRGLAKLCMDRSEFDIEAPLPPAELRHKVFRLARERGPVALEGGPLERVTADHVLAEVAEELGTTAATVAACLYADLRENHRVLRCDVDSATWLLHRYNVALVQALLLKASEVRIRLENPTAPRLRQLFRHVKFHQLIHSAKKVDGLLELTLDGPLSLFKQSTKYGMNLANFLPALLLQQGPWRMEATVLWTKARHKKTLLVDDGMGLVSHYADTGAYEPREVQYFRERFEAADSPWTLKTGSRPLNLAGRSVLVPDFTLVRGDDLVHLDIVGFWRREWLIRRLELLQRSGPQNLILAVSNKLSGSKEALEGFEGEVIEFSQVLSPKKVLEAAEAMCTSR
ncbi:MAG: DUF790 family protein [Deltaproteobacteria bacterium]|nr:MAG: DUF790 family protein [Deltaproteobacteria bacterium]